VTVLSEDYEQIERNLLIGVDAVQGQRELDVLAISGIALAVIESDAELVGNMLMILALAKTTIFVRMAPS